MNASKVPSRTVDKYDLSTRIIPGQKAFSLFTRRSNHRPIHGFRLRQLRGGVPLDEQGDVVADWAAIKSAVFLVHEPCDIGAGLRPGRRRRVSAGVGQWSAVDST